MSGSLTVNPTKTVYDSDLLKYKGELVAMMKRDSVPKKNQSQPQPGTQPSTPLYPVIKLEDIVKITLPECTGFEGETFRFRVTRAPKGGAQGRCIYIQPEDPTCKLGDMGEKKIHMCKLDPCKYCADGIWMHIPIGEVHIVERNGEPTNADKLREAAAQKRRKAQPSEFKGMKQNHNGKFRTNSYNSQTNFRTNSDRETCATERELASTQLQVFRDSEELHSEWDNNSEYQNNYWDHHQSNTQFSRGYHQQALNMQRQMQMQGNHWMSQGAQAYEETPDWY